MAGTRLYILLMLLLGFGPGFSQSFVMHKLAEERDSEPEYITEFNGRLYFFASNDTDYDLLYYTDGTAAGPRLLLDSQGRVVKGGRILGVGGDLLYMYARAGDEYMDLWATDGTPQGTYLVKDINSQAFPGGLSQITTGIYYNGKYYFGANDGLIGNELWVTDGSEAGTRLVKDIHPGSGASTPFNFFVFAGKLFFTASDGATGTELWSSDGTEAGTQILKDIHPDGGAVDGLFVAVEMGGRVYFSANDGTHGEELWYTDGTAGGTQMLLDLNPGSALGVDFKKGKVAVMGDHLYFTATTTAYATEIWKSDGTPEGTVLLKDIVPYGVSGFPGDLFAYNHRLYFACRQYASSAEPYLLWVSDGTEAGTQLFAPRDSISNPQSFYKFNEMLYFSAENDIVGRALFRTDGTPENTEWLRPEWYTGTYGISNVVDFVTFRNNLFFKAQYLGKSDLWSYGDTIVAALGFPEPPPPLQMYPNPAQHQLTINYIPETLGELHLLVYSADGRRIHSQTLQASHGTRTNTLQIPFCWPNGIYFIRLSGQGIDYSGRFVVLK